MLRKSKYHIKYDVREDSEKRFSPSHMHNCILVFGDSLNSRQSNRDFSRFPIFDPMASGQQEEVVGGVMSQHISKMPEWRK